MTQQQTTARGFALLSGAMIFSKLMSVIYLPVQTHLVGNAGNGVINAGYTGYFFVLAMASSGVVQVLGNLIAGQTTSRGRRTVFLNAAAMITAMGFLLSLMMVLLSRTVAVHVLHQPDTAGMLRAFAPAVALTSVAACLRGWFQGHGNMAPTALSQVVEQLINSVLTLGFIALLIPLGRGAAAAGSAAATSLAAAGACVMLCLAWHRSGLRESNQQETPVETGLSRGDILRRILRYALPVVLVVLTGKVYDLSDGAMGMAGLLQRGLTPEGAAAAYGVYSAQYQKLLSIPLTLTAAMPAAILPALYGAWEAGDHDAFRSKVREAFRVVLMILIPAAALLAVLGRPAIALIFFSMEHNDGAALMATGSWVLILTAVGGLQNSVLSGAGRPWVPVMSAMAGMALKLVGNQLLIPLWGMQGAVAATTAGLLFNAVLNFVWIFRKTPCHIPLLPLLLRPLPAVGVMTVIARGTYQLLMTLNPGLPLLWHSDLALLVAGVAGGLPGLWTLFRTGALTPADLKRVPGGSRLIKLLRIA